MENEKLKKSVTIGDEALEDVSGGTSSGLARHCCDSCKKMFQAQCLKSYKGYTLCLSCLGKAQGK